MPKKKKPVTVEDLFNQVFKQQKEFQQVLKEDREHLNKLTNQVNQLNSAITTAKSAKTTNPKGQGLMTVANAISKGIEFVIKHPDKIFSESKPQDALYKKHKDLYDKVYETNLKNMMELSNLEVAKRKKEIERIGKTGWDILG